MLLALSVRNRITEVALFEGDELEARWTLHTQPATTADELAMTLDGLLGESDVTGFAALSTVPAMLATIRETRDRYFGELASVVVEPGVRTGVPLLVDSPRDVGADRIVNALAAHEQVGGGAVVVDAGSSTVVDVVSEQGALLGGAIAPGIEVAVRAMADENAALRHFELAEPREVIGKSTTEAMQSGAVYGFAGLVDGLVRRLMHAAGDALGTVDELPVLATGPLAPLILPVSQTITEAAPTLTLDGLRLVFERNEARRAKARSGRG